MKKHRKTTIIRRAFTKAFALLLALYAAMPSLASESDLKIPRTGISAMSLPSAEVSALCSHIESSYSYSTGKATVSFPLYTIRCGELSLPLTISYQTGGMKVDEEPGQTGLCWTLDYGGSISRSVAGRPDSGTDDVLRALKAENVYPHFNGGPLFNPSDTIANMRGVVGQQLDPEYDRYHWQAGAESGSFIIAGSEIVQLTQTDAKIERYGSGFRITVLDGTVYNYEPGESVHFHYYTESVSSLNGAQDYDAVCTWRLASVRDPSGCDVITFSYTPIADSHKSFGGEGSSVSVSGNLNQGAFNQGSVSGTSAPAPVARSIYDYTNRKALSRISWRGGSIVTRVNGTSSVIDSLTVKSNSGQPVLGIGLRYTQRLCGPSAHNAPILSEYGKYTGGRKIDGAKFSYNPTTGMSKDFFGYNNYGHDVDNASEYTSSHESVLRMCPGSLSLNPKRKPWTNQYGPASSGAAQGALVQIQTMAGTETTFEYEAASFPSQAFGGETFIGLRLRKETTVDGTTGTVRSRELTYSDPVTTVPLDFLDTEWYVSLSGTVRTEHSGGAMGFPYYVISTGASLLSSSRVPGTSPENATVYYGHVQEMISGTGIDTVYTTYEYDLDRVTNQLAFTENTVHVNISSDSRYCGTGISSVSVNSQYDPVIMSLISPKVVQSYYQEEFFDKAPLIRKTLWNGHPSHNSPRRTTEYRNSYGNERTVTTGYYCDNLVRDIVTTDLMCSLGCESPEDFSRFEVKALSARSYIDTVIVHDYDDYGHAMTTVTRYQYNNHHDPVPVGSYVDQDGQTRPLYSLKLADNSLPYKVTASCGDDSFETTYIYASTGLPWNEGSPMAETRPSLIIAESATHGGCTVTTNYRYSAFPSTAGVRLSSATVRHGGTLIDSVSITGYDGFGNPLAMVRNGGTPMRYTWSTDGLYMASSSSDNDLVSTYSHIPLVGYSSMTTPAGTVSEHSYSGMRLTRSMTADDVRADYAYETYGENNSVNEIRTTSYGGYSSSRAVTSVVRHDGFGNPIMEYSYAGGAGFGSAAEFDALGRRSRQYLPVPLTSSPSYSSGISAAGTYYDDAHAFSATDYDVLGRQVSSTIAGNEYRLHPSSTEYLYNVTQLSQAHSARRFTVSGDTLYSHGAYPAYTLLVAKVTDGDGRVSYTFTDYRGRVILTRALNGNTRADTYYVYDDADNVVMVLPPMCSAALQQGSHSWKLGASDALSRYAFFYRYDTAFRLTEKKMPGNEPIKYWYDEGRTQILCQDGNQRTRGTVSFAIPDRHGRLAISGECLLTPSLQSAVGGTHVCVSRGSSGYTGNLAGYSAGISLQSPRIDVACYYDDYDFMALDEFGDLSQQAPQTSAQGARSNNTGLLTGKLTRVLKPVTDPNPNAGALRDFVSAAYCYDYRERRIRTATIDHSGGYLVSDCTYSNSDNPVTVTESHTPCGASAAETVAYGYTYDSFDRMSSVTMTRNGNTTDLVQNTYNPVSQLASSKFGTAQPTAFTYAKHGAVKSITAPNFAQTLYYADSPAPSYCGNISAMEWSSGSALTRRYDYSYDGLNRLVSAAYSEQGRGSGSIMGIKITVTPDYSVSYTYDLNSNPLTVVRQGVTDLYKTNLLGSLTRKNIDFGTVDNLTYSYHGNRVVRVSDSADTGVYVGATDFYDGDDMDIEYTYDFNGNMTSDANRHIESVEYNILNLPVVVTFESGITLTNYYDAEGTLLRRNVFGTPNTGIPNLNPVSVNNIDDRVGGFVYSGASLFRIQTPTGYVERDSVYHYVHDYQGNVRQTVRNDGSVVQTSHYYPYGMLMGESTDILDANFVTQPPQIHALGRKYRFGGKEFITAEGLNLHDFNARMQDPAMIIFTTPDPKAWDTSGVSQYIYCGGNPINAIDADGKRVLFVNGYWIGGKIGEWIGSSTQGKEYWGEGFASAASSFFNDYSIIDASFIDGSSLCGGDMSGAERYFAGYVYAYRNIEALTEGMAENEVFNMVTHSEGSAYGAGVAAALLKQGFTVQTIVHLSADEGDEFMTPSRPFTIQLSYNQDWVTNNHPIKGTDLNGIVCKGNLSSLQVHGATKGKSVFNALRDLLVVAFENHIGQFNGQYRTWKSQLPCPNGTDFYMYNGNVILNFDGTTKY